MRTGQVWLWVLIAVVVVIGLALVLLRNSPISTALLNTTNTPGPTGTDLVTGLPTVATTPFPTAPITGMLSITVSPTGSQGTGGTGLSATGTMAGGLTFDLTEENNSGQSGTVTLKEESGKTRVTILLTGTAVSATQPAHIHTGSCPNVGAVKYSLNSVVNGKSDTVINVRIQDLKSQLPLGVNVHKSQQEAQTYVACGDLSL